MREAIDIPGPVDWLNASHWIEYDDDAQTVQTWCKTGPDYRYRMMTRIRPMQGSEILFSNMRDQPEADIRAALDQYLGVKSKLVGKPHPWWKFW